jgi:Ca-activated chloride channel homolog
VFLTGCFAVVNILAAAVSLAVSLRGDSPRQDTFSVSSDLVVLNVTVQDPSGKAVPGMDRNNFRVYEDHRLQQIQSVRHEDIPVAVALVVDNSSSMRPKKEEVAAAAARFARLSNPLDDLLILNFNETVAVTFQETLLADTRESRLKSVLADIAARGRTALYDAIAAGFDHLASAPHDKKVMIVISDGADNASHATFQEVLEKARRSNVVVYTIGLFDPMQHERNVGVLKKLAAVTGGRLFLPQRTSDIVEVGDRIAKEIRNQYTICYIPANREFDGRFRTVQVDVTTPDHRRWLVRARSGYTSPASDVGSRSEY